MSKAILPRSADPPGTNCAVRITRVVDSHSLPLSIPDNNLGTSLHRPGNGGAAGALGSYSSLSCLECNPEGNSALYFAPQMYVYLFQQMCFGSDPVLNQLRSGRLGLWKTHAIRHSAHGLHLFRRCNQFRQMSPLPGLRLHAAMIAAA